MPPSPPAPAAGQSSAPFSARIQQWAFLVRETKHSPPRHSSCIGRYLVLSPWYYVRHPGEGTYSCQAHNTPTEARPRPLDHQGAANNRAKGQISRETQTVRVPDSTSRQQTSRVLYSAHNLGAETPGALRLPNFWECLHPGPRFYYLLHLPSTLIPSTMTTAGSR